MNQNRNRLVLLLIFFLFATPVVTATLMHTSWWPYQPNETVNRGLLVEPTQQLDYSALAFGDGIAPPLGKWAVVYPLTSPCLSPCMANVESLRQIHRATGRRQNMLTIVPLLAESEASTAVDTLLEIYPAFSPAMDEGGSVAGQLAQIGDRTPDGERIDGQAFLVDPSGNIMMRYAAGFDPRDLNKDLKRLLKWSAQDG